jgi:putative transcriptional regulator
MKKASLADRLVTRLQNFAEALERGEKIAEKFTCRTVVLDLQPSSYNARRIRKVRESLGVSQGIFAQLLGVSVRTVQSWEQGKIKPSEMACRWLDEIQRDPEYWMTRLKNAIVPKTSPRPQRTSRDGAT